MALSKDDCLDGAKVAEVGVGGYKEFLVMAMPKDDGLDGAKVAEAIGVRLPDFGGAVRVRKYPPVFMSSPC
jgi:solute carrier family 25 phosphate transporter 23/24/25/41